VDQREIRLSILLERAPSLKVASELLEYNAPLPQIQAALAARFPLASEPHIETWQAYAAAAQTDGAFEVLRSKLVQLQFPIAEGISASSAYRDVTLRGTSPDSVVEATGLPLEHPELLQLTLYPSLGGVIPVLIAGCRPDFVALVQALGKKNEPEPIPDSMGSCLISNYNNWDRLNELRRQCESSGSQMSWAEEFRQHILPHKTLYQDRFFILSSDIYSDVPAAELQLPDDEWRDLSLTIRLEHEATHYLTLRLYSQLRTNVLDELWADYRGIIAALGHYRADWFLRFMGLHNYPAYQPGARLENYRGALSDEAFTVLQGLVKDAAQNLEHIDRHYADQQANGEAQSRLLLALTCLALEELAAQNALESVQEIVGSFEENSP